MEVEILEANSKKTSLAKLSNLKATTTILDIKKEIAKKKTHLYTERQSLKLDLKGKALKDNETLGSLGVSNGPLFLKDLGPQLGWNTVFLTEYSGPLFVYLWFYTRPAIIYGQAAAGMPTSLVVHIAAACWSFHYAKRLLETVFVHRFSHSTMPIRNLFKNCTYYWGFTAYVAYYVNHPLYTLPYFGNLQIYGGLAAFILCELGNLSIHLAFKNMRPAGSKVRKIPKPTGNPFTLLFNFVSCPNYTYESGSWAAFTIMTQCLAGGLFTLAGVYQMSVWALQKHRNYKKEFPNYPRGRKSIFPFVL